MATRKPAALDTTAQADVEGFDIEAWMEGAAPIVDSVQVTIKRHLVPKIEELDEKVRAAKSKAPVERSAADASPDADEVTEEYKALVNEYLGSFKSFTFRGELPGDREAILAAMRKDNADTSSPAESNIYRTAEYSVSPKLTVASVRKLAEKIGNGQFEKMVVCWSKLSTDAPEYDVPK